MTASDSATSTSDCPPVSARLLEKSVDRIVLCLPGTDYQLHLVPAGAVPQQPGEKVSGIIEAKARRIDEIDAGGRFVEPVYGRPRRVQGRVVGGDVEANLVYVSAGPTLALRPMAPQTAADFAIGQMITCGVEDGTCFRPVE